MAVSAISAYPTINLPSNRQQTLTGLKTHVFQPLAAVPGSLHHFFKRLNELDGRTVRVRVLNIKVLFSSTAIVYQATKIFVLDTLLIRNVYKIIKMLKRIFAFADGDNNTIRWRSLLNDQRARHTLLKVTTNCFSVLEGAYDLIVRNELVKMAYVSIGLGANFQPFSASVMSGMETILMPLSVLKLATRASHLFIAARKVWKLDKQAPSETKWANWVILGKASLDFGIEGLRWGLYFAGVSTGAYPVIFSLAFLGIVSNSLGMIKLVFPIKEMADDAPRVVVLVPQPTAPLEQK